jgi:tripartite-type tricarboxylate transporter receptor subunit TctC/transposase-like protein
VAKADDLNMASSRRRVIKGAAVLAAGSVTTNMLRIGTALAAFPDRPVKIVVANSPGGPSDIVARLLAAALQQALGGSFVVENKGGAGGNIGMGSVARADPDGYTLLITTSAYVVHPGLYNNLPYDPFKDFIAIAELASTPNVFAVNPQLGVKTMRELIALAKGNPDKFNVSTPPIGTTPYLAIELLKVRERLFRLPILVFAGGGEALQALLGNTVQLSVGALAPAHPHLKAGAIIASATTGAKRWHDLPKHIKAGLHSSWRNTVLALVERGGSVRTFHIDGTTMASLLPIIRVNVNRETAIITDEWKAYRPLGKEFASHEAVDHSAKEYVRGTISTNTVEGYFSIFKRGMKGVYQHCSEKHLHRYLAEFDFRYTTAFDLATTLISLPQMVQPSTGLRPYSSRYGPPSSRSMIGERVGAGKVAGHCCGSHSGSACRSRSGRWWAPPGEKRLPFKGLRDGVGL